MKVVEANLGVHTADAERVAVHFDAGALVLSYVDWQERPQRTTFHDVLAFRWQECDDAVPRDDMSYEVVDSPWLERQCHLQAVPAAGHAHYKL